MMCMHSVLLSVHVVPVCPWFVCVHGGSGVVVGLTVIVCPWCVTARCVCVRMAFVCVHVVGVHDLSVDGVCV